ncbi:hypothetical protein OK016_06295 [Vibrio chagasii]|nr:hypothetical protein [Vibrio chagasii]
MSARQATAYQANMQAASITPANPCSRKASGTYRSVMPDESTSVRLRTAEPRGQPRLPGHYGKRLGNWREDCSEHALVHRVPSSHGEQLMKRSRCSMHRPKPAFT